MKYLQRVYNCIWDRRWAELDTLIKDIVKRKIVLETNERLKIEDLLKIYDHRYYDMLIYFGRKL